MPCLHIVLIAWCLSCLHATRVQRDRHVHETLNNIIVQPSCADVDGATARDSQEYPACKCASRQHKVFCAGVLAAERKFDAAEVFEIPSCLRPHCAAKPSCDFVPGAQAVHNQDYPNCECGSTHDVVHCAGQEVTGHSQQFNAEMILANSKCVRAFCGPAPTCDQVEGAQARNSESYPNCKCNSGFHSVQCGDTTVAERKFNAAEVFSNPVCLRPRCVRAGQDCSKTFTYDPLEKYIAELRQGTPTDTHLVQMASIANRINNLQTPVAGWDLVKHWNIGDEVECAFTEEVGIYRREGRCVLSFSSLQHLSNVSANFAPWTGTWCGMEGVHSGYSGRLDTFIHGRRFTEFASFLNSEVECPKGVIGSGHSMGGALVTLMAACGNRRKYFEMNDLYTFATPGVAKTQVTNSLAADGCFRGARVYNMDSIFQDPIPAMSSPFGFKHPKLAEQRLKFAGDGSFFVKKHGCSSEHAVDHPRHWSKGSNPLLHPATAYIKRLLLVDGVSTGPDGKRNESKTLTPGLD